ncbi:leucyl aminopeptidase family protein [Pannonibacter tanglangensis]|uniref:leucyl aminopeptidase family protein n=1 Tax=Pannonibacter tanglangensis TaxID=2750084 RepID=UPI003299990E
MLIHPVTPATLAAVLDTLGGAAAGWAAVQGYKAAAGSVLLVPGPGPAPAAVLFGVPDEGKGDLLAGGALAGLPAGDYAFAPGFAAEEQAAIAFGLGAYRFTRYRSGEQKEQPRLHLADAAMLVRVRRIVTAVAFARDLVNTPANDMGPAELETAATGLFALHGGHARVLRGDTLLSENFPLIHAVGRAADSARAPRLIDCTWGDETHPRVTLVGKGVVFDTGGLDIKPSSSMLLMKKDMGGAANVLGLAHLVMDARLPVRLRVLVPAVENAIAGNAFRPGDILPSRKGLTVEIGNTDAEGRLILADALALADEEAPELLLDMATLTGAARVALGPDLPPFYTADEGLAAALAAHADKVADPLWRLPLWQPYMKYLDSKVADLNNVNQSGAGFAGSVTAALFLSRFVEKAGAWAHFDIFAWTPVERAGKPAGGEGQALRALFSLLSERYPAN